MSEFFKVTLINENVMMILINHNDFENSYFSVKQHFALMFYNNLSDNTSLGPKHLELVSRRSLYFFRNVQDQCPWKVRFLSKKALGTNIFQKYFFLSDNTSLGAKTFRTGTKTITIFFQKCSGSSWGAPTTLKILIFE